MPVMKTVTKVTISACRCDHRFGRRATLVRLFVDAPSADRPLTLNGRHNLRPHDAKHGIVRPVALSRSDAETGVSPCRHTRAAIRSTLLHSPSKKQPGAIRPSRVTRRRASRHKLKTRFTRFDRLGDPFLRPPRCPCLGIGVLGQICRSWSLLC